MSETVSPTVILALGLCGLLSFPARSSAAPGPFTRLEFQSLLQGFVQAQYLRSFRRLGEEADFDHAHLLYAAGAPERPVALLYHTQELSRDGSLDPKARNWLQWVASGQVEPAARYERRTYPATPSWDYFRSAELPALRERHTILDKMLDPALLGAEVQDSRQWVFTRAECAPQAAPAESLIRIVLPSGAVVCLALGQ